MKNVKIILTEVLVLTIIIGLFNVVFAIDDDDLFMPINDDRSNNTTTTATATPAGNTASNNLFNGTATATPAATSTPTQTPTYKNNTTNTTSNSSYNNTNLPHAGSSDGIFMGAVIVVFGVVALYAYKKIKEYNI